MLESQDYWIGLVGIAAFAITGVLAVIPKGIDIFGAAILGMLTAVGGGTIRDVILGVPVFWATDSTYITVSLVAGVTAFWAKDLFSQVKIHRLMLYIDGFGAAMFAISSVSKTWHLDFGRPMSPVILGVVTAVGGGLIRDTLANRPNLLMTSHELYLTPVLLGCVVFAGVLRWFPELETSASLFCIALIFILRSTAIYFQWGVPRFLVAKPSSNRQTRSSTDGK